MRALLLLLLAGAPEAEATPISPSALAHAEGHGPESWRQLAMELGSVVANPALGPARTLGIHGFDISAGATLAPLRGSPPWEGAHPSEAPAEPLIVPQLEVRKGLPMSFEAGGRLAWLPGSTAGVFGAHGRVAPVEGYAPWPDISLQVGYAAYVGNPELRMGVLDVGVRMGRQWRFGRTPGFRHGTIAPWIDFSLLYMEGTPLLDPVLAEESGFYALSSRSSSPHHVRDMRQPRLGGGLQLVNGNVLWRLSGSWVPGGLSTATAAMGFSY